MSGCFVTGTDTGVGKTVVAAAICACTGMPYRKPVQTGSDDDASEVRRLAGVDARSLARLREPLAPSVAARMEGIPLDVAVLLAGCTGACVVEGAGGALVPLYAETVMADLPRMLGIPAVVVARPGLGTLNHTALTIEALRARGAEVLGVVVCRFPDVPGLAERTNPREIERLASTRLLGVVPEMRAWEPEVWLGPLLGGRWDRASFLETL